MNVPAYDCNWPFCFYVSCERNQTEDVTHCLCIVCWEAAHRLSHINGPCFIAFLLKNNIQILFRSHWKKSIYIHVYIYTDYSFQIIYTHPFFGYFQFATLYFCCLFVLQFNFERIDCFWPSFSWVPLARLTKWSFELVLSKSSKINIFENSFNV